ncbi:protein of unknown function [Bradyrhizobium vignae]|uniref:Transposase n=1 Tax=Bradyrhizobium vignae TaxID=1549949 RepID=A0A2U3QA08_9BRAD|nr:protein of unknown function [Bradyrhizobium vignae]
MMRYLRWLQAQQFDHPAHQIALQEVVEAVRIARERVDRLERTIEEFVSPGRIDTPPKIGKTKLYRLEQTSPAVREIAWKAQSRLTARYRKLAARGKRTTVVCTAIARELVGFMWAVARQVQQPDLSALLIIVHGRRRSHGRGNARQTLCGRQERRRPL